MKHKFEVLGIVNKNSEKARERPEIKWLTE